LRLRRGRFFTPLDLESSDPVIVINDALANRFWPQRNPIGECIRLIQLASPCRRIVGVVGNARPRIAEPAVQVVYEPKTQTRPACCFRYLNVRTRGPATLADVDAIRRTLESLGFDNNVPPHPMRALDRLEPQLRPWRISAILFGAFGILALATAMAGVYGLVGYDVAERTHELGIRITLGATSGSVIGLVVSSAARIVGVGILAGTVGALFGGRLLASLLFETSPSDPRALSAAIIGVLTMVVIASLIPAWRATRLDPAAILRAE
jgi:ABC-type lipoprotein release transport system permease subunit